MPLVHSLYMYGDRAIFAEASFFRLAMHVIGHMAPVFLFSMGLSFVFSRNQAPWRSARRGLHLLLIAYTLTAAQFLIPIWANLVPESFFKANGWTSQLSAQDYLHLLTEGDVLHLAGIALLFMGLLRKWIRSWQLLLALALLIAVLSGYIQGYRPGVLGLDYLCDLLWGREWNVYFPVVPWAASIVLGLAFGTYMQACGGETSSAFKLMFPLGLVMAILGGALWWQDPAFHHRDFFHMGPGATIHLMGVTLLLFRLFRLFEQGLLRTGFGRLACYASARVTSLYVTHWLLISWGMCIVGYREHGPGVVIALSFLILAGTLAVEAAYRRGLSTLRASFARVTSPSVSSI